MRRAVGRHGPDRRVRVSLSLFGCDHKTVLPIIQGRPWGLASLVINPAAQPVGFRAPDTEPTRSFCMRRCGTEYREERGKS